MAGSPKKRARRAAAQASRGGARARARGKAAKMSAKESYVGLRAKSLGIAPVPPGRVPSDPELVQIAKGVLLAVAREGEPQDQVRAAWQLGDLAGARRVKVAVPKAPDASGRPLDKLSDAELDALAAEAERTLRSTTQ